MGEVKFKVGDRVAVYGWTFGGSLCNGAKGTVKELPATPATRVYRVSFDKAFGGYDDDSVHEKQIRRLVKRERRKCTLHYSNGGGWVIEDPPEARDNDELVYSRYAAND